MGGCGLQASLGLGLGEIGVGMDQVEEISRPVETEVWVEFREGVVVDEAELGHGDTVVGTGGRHDQRGMR